MTINITLEKQSRSLAERLSDDGASDLSDADLLSLFINKKGELSSLERAQAVLKSTPLIKLFKNPYSAEFRALGLSRKQLSQIHAGMELAKRSVAATMQGVDALTSPGCVREYLALQLTGFEDERFCVVLLSNRHVPIAFETISFGTIDSAAVYPRSVLKLCLKHNAAACIFAHNHPSGVSAEPSDTDVRLTRKLIDALSLADVRVLDHLVYAQGISTSLAERGLM